MKNFFFPSNAHDTLFQIEDGSYWFRHRNQIILNGIQNFPPEENIVVDIGGGNGYVSKKLQDQGMVSVVFEPIRTGALNARQRGIQFVFNSTFTPDVVCANQVPAVALFDVIEHLEDDQAFLRTIIYPSLKEKGKMYITVPAHQGLWSADDAEAGHFRRYSIQSLKNILEKNGFRILYITYFFKWLCLPIFLFRTLPSKLHKRAYKSVQHTKNEFIVNEAKTSRILKLFSSEVSNVKRQKQMRFGASLFVIAEKINDHERGNG